MEWRIYVAWTALSHYLNKCCNIVNWNLRNKLQWNFKRNSYIFIQENALECVVCEMPLCLGLNVLRRCHSVSAWHRRQQHPMVVSRCRHKLESPSHQRDDAKATKADWWPAFQVICRQTNQQLVQNAMAQRNIIRIRKPHHRLRHVQKMPLQLWVPHYLIKIEVGLHTGTRFNIRTIFLGTRVLLWG